MITPRSLRITGAIWFVLALTLVVGLSFVQWTTASFGYRVGIWAWFEAKLWLLPAFILLIAGSLPAAAFGAIVWVTVLMGDGWRWQTNDWFHLIVPAMLAAAAVWSIWSEIQRHKKKEVIVPNQPPTERRPGPRPAPFDHD